ncbi:hypothetical protein DPMN_033693 [Dreissena polymorpha]|uniref:Uncharacterized protein n=1 Tax=Dreissena polymorpha TaxID=45954 RepID=A0A9D4M655_DREPO|nr:hypothetical protein DPMN_033693 [Dreissena polymorpha]
MGCSWSKASTHEDMKSPTTNSDTVTAENSSMPLENLTPSEIECEQDDFVAEIAQGLLKTLRHRR